MLLSGVRPGGAADKAGLQAGDRILAIGDTQIQSVKDLMYVLQAAKPGQEAVAKVERSGKTLVLKLVFQESKPRKH
jgi:S1-C subfamily serine protease